VAGFHLNCTAYLNGWFDAKQIMLRALTASASLLKRVVVFLLFFYLIFGIVGIQSFRGSLNRRCIMETDFQNGTVSDQPVLPEKACGSWYQSPNVICQPIGIDGTTDIICGDPGGQYTKGYACPVGQMCKTVDISYERPIGFIRYDNIFIAVFSIFQSVSEQGWTYTMYLTMDAEYPVAAVYHVFVIVVIDLVFMNMFVAVIAETFATVRAEYERNKVIGVK
jgi:hypothetical protein